MDDQHEPQDPRDQAESNPLINLEAEQGLLGAIMYQHEIFFDIADTLRAEDFSEPYHQRIYQAIGSSIRAGRTADASMMREALVDDPAFEQFGGFYYLADLMDKCPSAKVAKDYAGIITDLWMRRALKAQAEEVLQSVNNRQDTALDLVMAAERSFGQITLEGATTSAFENIGTIFARQFEKSRQQKGQPPGISTGIHELDSKLGGLRKKNVIVLGGRPGSGKSATAVQISINVASPSAEAPKGRGVMFYSLEMHEEQITTRFGCALAWERDMPAEDNPTYENFEKGELTENQWLRLQAAGAKLAEMPIEIDFRGKLKVSQMLAAARRQKRAWIAQGVEPGLIVIDHVLQVSPEKRVNDPVVEISQIANDILDMAKILDMPILLLCQLGRDVDKRDDKRPIMSDLKWSGTLEENAAAIVFCYRPEFYNRVPKHDAKDAAWKAYNAIKERYTNRMLLLIEKNRGGRSHQEVETLCLIGCNVIVDLSGEKPLTTKPFDFSAGRLAEENFAAGPPPMEEPPFDPSAYGLDDN